MNREFGTTGKVRLQLE